MLESLEAVLVVEAVAVFSDPELPDVVPTVPVADALVTPLFVLLIAPLVLGPLVLVPLAASVPFPVKALVPSP